MENNKRNSGKRVASAIIGSGIAATMGFLINFILTPLVTNSLGTEAYGYVTLANTFVSYATIVTIALNSYSTRYISLEYHKNNLKKCREYFSSIFYSNIIISIVILIIATIFVWNIEKLIHIPANMIGETKVLFLFVFLNFVILTLGNVYSASAYIKEHLDLVGVFKAIAYGIEILFLLIGFKILVPRMWYVGVALIGFSSVILFSNYYIYKKCTPEINFKISDFSFKSVKEVVLNGIWNSVNSLGNTLNSGFDLIITNLMLNSLTMGKISIAKSIGTIMCILYQLVSQAFQPLFLKSYAMNDRKKLLRELIFSMKLSGIIAGLVFSGFVILGQDFLNLWLPGQDTLTIYNLTIIVLLSYVLEGVVGPLYYIYTLMIKNKIPCIITILGGIINISAMYILLIHTNGGGYIVVGTTAVIMIFINLVSNPLYMCKCLEIKWYTFYPTIIKYIFYIVVMLIAFKYIIPLLKISGWIELIFNGIVISIVGTVIYFFLMLNKQEKEYLLKIFNQYKKH